MDSTIPPLTKRNQNGLPYTRASKVEARIKELIALPPEQIVEQVEVLDPNSPRYVPSEAIVHLLRWKKVPDNHPGYVTVWQTLMARIVIQIGCTNDPETALSRREDIVRNHVVDRVVDLLVSDRHSPNENLDFYEVRFGMAIKRLEASGGRNYESDRDRRAPLEIDPDSGEISVEVEKSAGSFDPLNSSKLDDPDYRSRLDAAIDLLEPMQQKIIHMLSLGYQVESEKPDIQTISTILKRTPKTIRSQRNKAFIRLRELLSQE